MGATLSVLDSKEKKPDQRLGIFLDDFNCVYLILGFQVGATNANEDEVIGIAGHGTLQLSAFNQQNVALGQMAPDAAFREQVEQTLKEEEAQTAGDTVMKYYNEKGRLCHIIFDMTRVRSNIVRPIESLDNEWRNTNSSIGGIQKSEDRGRS